jgi:hypothetical protein
MCDRKRDTAPILRDCVGTGLVLPADRLKIRLGLLAGGLVWYGVSTHSPVIAVFSVLLLIRAGMTVRIVYCKLQPVCTTDVAAGET